MDKRFMWSAGVLTALVVVTKTPFVFTLFALFVLGIIPGTSLVIPAWLLLIVNPILFAGIVWIVRSHHLLTPIDTPQPTAQAKRTRRSTATSKKRTAATPKRRSSRATA